ncbi:MAG: DUF4026 domain-containing protein [Phycisphaerales bacterium]|nr:DUF4026 domain-containing protein [Phycisphaerales bacterium]
MRHPKFGEAKAAAFRNVPPYPQWEIKMTQALTPAEKEEFAAAGVGVVAFIENPAGDVLKDRKNLLHFLRLMMSDDGLFVTDHTSTLIWPRMALDEELSHDADLDVSQIFCTHAISGDESSPSSWYHTHGLGEIGAYDFDVINPDTDVFGGRTDIDRALAFASVEGSLKPGAEVLCFQPGGNVRAVDAAEFDRKASAADAAIRQMDDDSHQMRRVVLCDPADGFLSFFRNRPRPSSRLSNEIGEDLAVLFSRTASQSMSVRAQQTVELFEKARQEFERFGFPAIAKICYPTQTGELEHLWFSVHGMIGDTLDATLQNEPFDIPSLKRGARGRHPIEQLTDWRVLSPAGTVSPRGGVAARLLRQNPEKLEEMMATMRQAEPES